MNKDIRNYAPTRGYIDGDPIIYAACFASQKTRYYFVDGDGESVSKLLPSAKAAKQFLLDLEEMELDTSDLVRKSTVELLDLKVAIKTFDYIIKCYKKLAGNSVKQFKILFTSSAGVKVKDNEETELQYQHNRKSIEKPVHYKAVRVHAESFPEALIAPQGFEADNLLVSFAEKHGHDAVSISIDKDIGQLEGAWFIRADRTYKGTPVWCHPLGEIKDSPKGVIGFGFKFLCYQASSGDRSDGYHGIRGVGGKTLLPILEGLKTKSECMEAMFTLYLKHFGKEYTYTSWSGKTFTKSTTEMMDMHFNLAYMERSKGDNFESIKYL